MPRENINQGMYYLGNKVNFDNAEYNQYMDNDRPVTSSSSSSSFNATEEQYLSATRSRPSSSSSLASSEPAISSRVKKTVKDRLVSQYQQQFSSESSSSPSLSNTFTLKLEEKDSATSYYHQYSHYLPLPFEVSDHIQRHSLAKRVNPMENRRKGGPNPLGKPGTQCWAAPPIIRFTPHPFEQPGSISVDATNTFYDWEKMKKPADPKDSRPSRLGEW